MDMPGRVAEHDRQQRSQTINQEASYSHNVRPLGEIQDTAARNFDGSDGLSGGGGVQVLNTLNRHQQQEEESKNQIMSHREQNIAPQINNDLYGTLDVDDIPRSPAAPVPQERLEFNTIVAMEENEQNRPPAVLRQDSFESGEQIR